MLYSIIPNATFQKIVSAESLTPDPAEGVDVNLLEHVRSVVRLREVCSDKTRRLVNEEGGRPNIPAP